MATLTIPTANVPAGIGAEVQDIYVETAQSAEERLNAVMRQNYERIRDDVIKEAERAGLTPRELIEKAREVLEDSTENIAADNKWVCGAWGVSPKGAQMDDSETWAGTFKRACAMGHVNGSIANACGVRGVSAYQRTAEQTDQHRAIRGFVANELGHMLATHCHSLITEDKRGTEERSRNGFNKVDQSMVNSLMNRAKLTYRNPVSHWSDAERAVIHFNDETNQASVSALFARTRERFEAGVEELLSRYPENEKGEL